MSKLEKYLKEVKERCSAATEGPCEVIRFDNENGYISYQVETVLSNYREHECVSWHSELTDPKAKANAEFDAHARTDVKVLLEMVEYLHLKTRQMADPLLDKYVTEKFESLIPGGEK